MEANRREAQGHEFEEITEFAEHDADRLKVEDLNEVQLRVAADLGRCTMKVHEVLELKRGSVIQLEKLAGEMTDIYINNLPLARGEVVVIGDELHVRVGELLGQSERSLSTDEADQDDD